MITIATFYGPQCVYVAGTSQQQVTVFLSSSSHNHNHNEVFV